MNKLIGLVFVAMLSTSTLAWAENVNELKARLVKEIDASPLATDGLKTFVKSTLLEECTNPVFVEQVKTQNAEGLSLDEIRKLDEEWIYSQITGDFGP